MTDDTPSDRDIRLRRLKFRSWHRGIKEMDLILGHFADGVMAELSPGDLDQYEALIELEDTTLYNWITGREPTPAEHDTPVLARIRSFNHLEAVLWQRKS
ncbi:MAG: succinate dehydrogenase assembly factor 2 [Parvibaculum sp.]|jgi:antitoxin CptB|uniref:FAD assembly factor SdhE n=1 Tax=Parvibaculum sp. TaxID=2024848 RepID=UPI00284BCE59|nr:succinate dehydrogenase assembly factor 2 [Parvibaculum sp.]MDR3500079.1 succinate dehydrogenase assembly factor 2 [Parvibaculum sp.]